MSTDERKTECLGPDTLAAFAEGNLTRSEIAPVLAHLETCARCMSALESAHHVLGETEPRSRRWPLFAAAAAIAAALLLAVPAVLRTRSPMARLVASVPQSERLVEARVTGFDYAPYRGPERLGNDRPDIESMKLLGIVGELADRANREPSAEHAHDAGIGLMLVARPLEAAEQLRGATAKAPNDAKNWSDLAAALYAAALQLDRPSLYPQALDAADRALRIAPDSREALFNRALIIERLRLAPAARTAWKRYLEIDPSSPWADEARTRLQKLDAATGASLFDRDRPQLENAAASGDRARVTELVKRYPQQARTWSEFEYLSRGDGGSLTIARNIGDALVRTSGESLLRDAVRAIDEGDGPTRAAIAKGQLLYKRGRTTYSKGKPSEADGDLREAASHFAAGRSPMALVARYFAANTRFDRNDVAGATAELDALLDEADALPRYAALGAQVRWELALCRMYDGDWSGALALLNDARATFERLGERNNLGFIHSLLATTQISLGRSDDAWASRIRAFEILSAEAHGDRLAASLGGTAQMEIRAGRLDSARALLALEEPFDRESKNDLLLVRLFVRRAIVSATLGDDDAALHAREARAVADRVADPQLRALAEANADLAEGAATLLRDPRGARERLTHAIDFYRTSASPAFLPEALLLRAKASERLGQRAEALRDLDGGADAVERHRVQYAGSVTGTNILDAGPALLRESIRLRLDLGNVDEAFASAERAYAQLAPADARPVSIEELQRRLAGSDAAVLALTLLPREVIAFAITANDRACTRNPADERHVLAVTDLLAGGDADAARQLYELLIRPSQTTLASARSLIVIAPPPLDAIPFAALYDANARRFLVESWRVAVAPSSSALEAAAGAPAQTAVVIALRAPSHEEALPESIAEVADVRRLYPGGTELAGDAATFRAFATASERADVVHLASHTEKDPASDELAFTFAGERVSWRTIAAMKLRPTATVLLSACESLRRLHIPDARTLSLGGGFVAAGASDVVGTLAPIRDSEARELFLDIHRHLAAGECAADAVRAAQLAALATERSTGRRGAWRSVALLTRRIPQRRTS